MAVSLVGIGRSSQSPLSSQIAAGPDATSTMRGYFRPLALGKVVTTIVNHQTKETVVPISTMGVIMPLKSKELEMKAEGERSWDWQKIFATPDLILETDDKIVWKGKTYRVLRQADWSGNGMVRYEAVNDYTGGNRV